MFCRTQTQSVSRCLPTSRVGLCSARLEALPSGCYNSTCLNWLVLVCTKRNKWPSLRWVATCPLWPWDKLVTRPGCDHKTCRFGILTHWPRGQQKCWLEWIGENWLTEKCHSLHFNDSLSQSKSNISKIPTKFPKFWFLFPLNLVHEPQFLQNRKRRFTMTFVCLLWFAVQNSRSFLHPIITLHFQRSVKWSRDAVRHIRFVFPWQSREIPRYAKELRALFRSFL